MEVVIITIGQISRIMIVRRVHLILLIRFRLKQRDSLNALLTAIILKIIVIMERKKPLFLL